MIYRESMDRYVLVLTFVSIILGVAVAKALDAIAPPIQGKTQSNFYPLHFMVVTLVILLMIQFWWGIFDEQAHEHWSFIDFLQTTATPILFYFVAAIFTPTDSGVDTKALYWQRSRRGLLCLVVLIANNILGDQLGPDTQFNPVQDGLRGASMLIGIAMAFSTREKLHFAGYSFFYAALAGFVAVSA